MELIKYVIIVPTELDSYQRKYIFPYIANQILSISNYEYPYILENFFHNPPSKIKEDSKILEKNSLISSSNENAKSESKEEKLDVLQNLTPALLESLPRQLSIEISQSSNIISDFQENKKGTILLEELFAFLNSEDDLNTVLANYFHELVLALLRHNTLFMMDYILNNKLPALFRHSYNDSICWILKDLLDLENCTEFLKKLMDEILNNCLLKFISQKKYTKTIFARIFRNLFYEDLYFEYFMNENIMKLLFDNLKEDTVEIINSIFSKMVAIYEKFLYNKRLKFEKIIDYSISYLEKIEKILSDSSFQIISHNPNKLNIIINSLDLVIGILSFNNDFLNKIFINTQFPRLMISFIKNAPKCSILISKILLIFKYFLRSQDLTIVEAFSLKTQIL